MRSNTCLVLILLIGVAIAPPVFGATITVTNTNDSGSGSLRDAIQTAAAGDTIQFSLPNPSTIFLNGGSLNIGKNLTITGPGAASLTIDASSNTRRERVLTIAAGFTVSISNLTITGGLGRGTFQGATDGNGGAVFNMGTLSLTGVVVSNSHTSNTVIGGGGIFNAGSLTLTNSTVTGNTAGGNTLGNPATTGGGIRSASGTTLTLTNTTVSNNFAQVGGGIWSNGTSTITNSTFSGNNGGSGISTGIALDGGAIFVRGPVNATIVNSTFSGNIAKSRGAAVAAEGTVDIINSTFSSNTTDGANGGVVSAFGNGNLVRLKGNILSNAQNCLAAGGTISSSGYNVATDATCSLDGQGDAPSTAAGLDAGGLQNNGGPTQTVALLSGSAAKDRIPPAFCTTLDNTALTTDQRGTPRPQGTNCDSGAFELTQGSLTVTNANDNGPGSLRQAIQDANVGDTINFDLTYPATIILSTSLNITKNLTIHGPGAAKLSIDGNHSVPIVSIGSGGTVSVSGLTFANGSGFDGGAVLNSGTLTIGGSVFTGNSGSQGGAINNQPGAIITVSDTTFSENSATSGSGLGGGLWNFGTATVRGSTFSNNHALDAADAYNGGKLTIINSTFANNQAAVGVGAVEHNSNDATKPLHLSNSTFFDNGGPLGGAFYNNSGPATIKGTLFAGAPSNDGNCGMNMGTVSSAGYNLSDDTSCGALGLNDLTDRNNTPAGLDGAGLQDNGGLTKTIALLSTSAAIDVIATPCSDVDGATLATDQRGMARPFGTGCDIGALESTAPFISGFSPAGGPVGTSVTITGTRFTGASAVKFNGTNATFSADSDTQITATVPNGATSGAISVTAPGGTGTSSANFAVAPAISDFTPTTGPVGTSVTITGTNFSGASAVTFGGVAATFTVNNATQITATVPTGAITGPIAVTTADGTSTTAASFTVTTVGPAPTITSVSPNSGIAGTLVTINGTNFVSGATTVSFGNASTNQVTVTNGGKKIAVNVPAGATTGPITVTTAGGTATSGTDFTIVTQAPKIMDFSPKSGKAGMQVQISGDHFVGVTSVMFDGKAAKFTVNSDAEIIATVPNGLKANTQVPITVANPLGSDTSATLFTVTK